MKNGTEYPESDKQLQEFVAREEFVHYAGFFHPQKRSVLQCIKLLEKRHYEMVASIDDTIFMRIIRWCDMEWLLVSVPVEEKDLIESVAEECGLGIFNQAPIFVGSEGVRRFPADNGRIFTFENKQSNPIYCNICDSN